jgi:hypothetical protein
MPMDYHIFSQATKNKKKIILTYFSGEQSLYLTKLCVPIQFCSSKKENIADSYYFWDSEADVGERLLALTTSQIAYMELSDETFDPAEYIIPEKH